MASDKFMMMELTKRKMTSSSVEAEGNGAKNAMVSDYVTVQRQPSEAFLASSKRAHSTQQNLTDEEGERVPGWRTVITAFVFFVTGLVSYLSFYDSLSYFKRVGRTVISFIFSIFMRRL